MKKQRKNITRALFLLLVFSLNTIVGFACSIGIDMGFNSRHHQPESCESHSKTHSNNSHQKHSHETSHEHQHKHSGTAGDAQDDCCANDVTRFIQLDKAIVKNNLSLQAPIFFVAFTSSFIQPLINETTLANSHRFQFVRRSCSIYDTDIRIAIQSFQI